MRNASDAEKVSVQPLKIRKKKKKKGFFGFRGNGWPFLQVLLMSVGAFRHNTIMA